MNADIFDILKLTEEMQRFDPQDDALTETLCSGELNEDALEFVAAARAVPPPFIRRKHE